MVQSADVSGVERRRLRHLLDDAFDGTFTDDDWEHALGGWHAIVTEAHVLSHVAVVARRIEVGRRELNAGYVEAVATAPSARRHGHASRAMRAAMVVLRREFEVGALSTNVHRFYERLGWERWLGPSFVVHEGQRVRSVEDDDGVMVLRFGPSSGIALDAPIACHTRAGDDW